MCHALAFFIGFILDLILGDPSSIPHPVRFIGKLIEYLDKKLHLEGSGDYVNRKNAVRGTFLEIIVVLVTDGIYFALFAFSYYVNRIAGVIIEALLSWQLLAVKSLNVESMKVYEALEKDDIPGARRAVSMLVARDTESLDKAAVIRAAVETVSENTCDGVIAPLLYLALGGPVLGAVYKAVNTADSMIGYKNERYLYFGRTAARVDDVLNFLPARLAAGVMLLAARILVLDTANAARIYKRDALKTASPNAGQTEAVCAGALDIALGGDAVYFGKNVHKAVIGDPVRGAENEDIKTANELMICTGVICAMAFFLVLSVIAAVVIWI
ncbi:MAG: cobalamin biosynthesis protein CobD [Lachnospiraceae bacterium]|nr:cobalamin biosynthesis protein CobD [Lachnospiraceae bacterium]